MSVTQKKVADRLGLSQRAVAFALSDSPHARKQLRPETRRRILATARKLGYAPNVHARRLVRGRADHVALIVRFLESPFYAQLADQFVRTFCRCPLSCRQGWWCGTRAGREPFRPATGTAWTPGKRTAPRRRRGVA